MSSFLKEHNQCITSVFATGRRPHLGEVTNDVSAMLVDLSQDVEDKRLHVKVKRLVVEE